MKGLEGTFSAWSREPGGGGLAEMDPSGAAERAAARFAAILARAAEAPTGLIHLTGDGRRMRLAGAFGLLAGWVNREPIPIDSMLIGIVFDCQHPVMISDILDDPRVPTHALARELGIRSYAGFPIHGDREQIIGVCSVVDYRPREWSARELTAVDEAAQAYSEFLAAQRHSEKQRRFLDAVLQNMAHGVAACDEEGRMVFSNGPLLAMNDAFPVGVPILEWAPEHNPLTHLDGRLVASESLPLLRVLRGEEVHGAEYLLPFSDGHTHRVSIDARPILGGDGRRQG
ncbi:GAF domain-containing protein, partial [Actinoplanes regularis]